MKRSLPADRLRWMTVRDQIYEDIMANQVKDVIAKRGAGDIDKLLRSGDTWEVR